MSKKKDEPIIEEEKPPKETIEIWKPAPQPPKK